jgi:DNA-binding SARP family transcriptional activator
MDAPTNPIWELRLLGYWELRYGGRPVTTGVRQQRLIAALAILGGRSRRSLASLLWPDSSEARAAGNLRASVFRITHYLPRVLREDPGALRLDEGVAVDLTAVRLLMARMADDRTPGVSLTEAEALRTAALLPGWYDDWVTGEQDRLNQQRLWSLEVLARHYLADGHAPLALDAASTVAVAEPLRESAQLLLVQARLACGDQASALRGYLDYRHRLAVELGALPSATFGRVLDLAAAPAPQLAGTIGPAMHGGLSEYPVGY